MTQPGGAHYVLMTPILRFMKEFIIHAEAMPSVYDQRFAERLAEKTETYRQTSNRLVKSVAQLDAFLLFLAVTKDVNLTLLGLNLSTLSYTTEAIFLVAAAASVFAALTFLTWHGHVVMIGEWCRLQDPVDPEYLQASYSNQELFLKIFRADLNINQHVRPDFFAPETGFRTAAKIVNVGLSVILIVLLLVHVGILTKAGLNIWQAQRLGTWGTGSFLFGCTLANVYAIGVGALISVKFKFRSLIGTQSASVSR